MRESPGELFQLRVLSAPNFTSLCLKFHLSSSSFHFFPLNLTVSEDASLHACL